MRSFAVVTLALLAAVAAQGAEARDVGTMASLLDRFEAFKSKHGRKYATDRDEANAFTNYVANMKAAAALNKANPLARFGDNEYADVSAADFKTMHNAERYLESELQRRAQRKTAAVSIGSVAQGSSHVDWRKRGAVTYVKNQGLKCGSCWSFSTTGNIEGQWFLAGHPLVALSEQELVSCDTTNGGCHGGLMDNAFEWLVSTRGGNISTEVAYPYVSANGYVPACGASGSSGSAASASSSSGGLDVQAVQAPPAFVTGATITGHHDLPSNEQQMGQWMLTGGPISIAVDATSWQLYQGGIMTNCISDKLDHAVLAVGFDDTNNPPYWIVKNSWGPSWGESGFIRVQKGTNQCLINSAPTTSIVTKAGPVPPAPPVPTTVAPSPTSPPPPPSPTTPPTPPAANGTFTQYQCSDAACQQNCNGQTFLQNSCLSVQGGGSAIAVCGAQGITLTYFANVSDCTGSSQQQLIPVDQCVADGAGTYSYDTCQGSSSGGSSSAGNGQLLENAVASSLRLHPSAAHRLRNRKYHGRH